MVVYLLLKRASIRGASPLSDLRPKIEFDLEPGPSRSEYYQNYEQQQEDHKQTLLSAP